MINITVIKTGSWGGGCGSFREGFLEEATFKLGPKGVGRSLPSEVK